MTLHRPLYRFVLSIGLLTIAGCTSPQLKLNWEGNEALAKHDFRVAAERYQQSLAEAEKNGDAQLAASAVYGMGRANGYMCNYADAEKYMAESIARREHLPDTKDAYLSQNFCELGRLYLAEKKWEDAAAQFARAVPRLEYLGAETRDPIGYADLLEDYENALRNSGRPTEAAQLSRKIAEIHRENPSRTAQFKHEPYPSSCDSTSRSLGARTALSATTAAGLGCIEQERPRNGASA